MFALFFHRADIRYPTASRSHSGLQDMKHRVSTMPGLHQGPSDERVALAAESARQGSEAAPVDPVRVTEITALFQAGKYREVLALTSALGSDLSTQPRLVRMHALCLESLGSRDELSRFLAEDVDEAVLPDHLAETLFMMRLRLGINVSTSDYRRYWGEPSADIGAALTNLPVERFMTNKNAALTTAVLAIRGEGSADHEAFARRLAWGTAAQKYLQILARLTKLLRQRQNRGLALDDEEKQILVLGQQSRDLAEPCDTAAFRAVTPGRSVLLSRAHAGINTALAELDKQTGLELILITANARTRLASDGEMRLGTRGDFQTGFLKLVKTLRRSPRLIRIFPDGNAGEQGAFELLGRKVQLGLGGATLAWHGQAATFFAGTCWQGTRIQPYLRVGPVADHAGSREDFEAAFHEFYLDCLKDILLGPPEDMVGAGGIWRAIIGEHDQSP